tara:strand:+ start:830 stop:1849 length:1020 start_codon:yes stop_codon:yes gene_type:complete
MESVFTAAQPSFLVEQAEFVIYNYYGFKCFAEDIYSDRDQNFYIRTSDKKEYILKISNSLEKKSVIMMQNEAIKFICRKDPAIVVPLICKSTSGDEILEYKYKDNLFYVRLLQFVPGNFIKDQKKNQDSLFKIGSFLARLDNALEGFDHIAGHRDFAWNLSQKGFLIEFGESLKTEKHWSIVESFLMKKTEYLRENHSYLREGIIHNDGNDHNIITDDDGNAIGIIDFGDMAYSYIASEPAIAMAYISINSREPLLDMGNVLKGFHKFYKLSDAELRFTIYLVCLRLSISVTMSSYRSSLFPDNKYLTISENRAWAFLKKMQKENLEQWADKLLKYAKS